MSGEGFSFVEPRRRRSDKHLHPVSREYAYGHEHCNDGPHEHRDAYSIGDSYGPSFGHIDPGCDRYKYPDSPKLHPPLG